MTRKSLRDPAIALSTANLLFLRPWYLLLSSSIFVPEFGRNNYLAALLDVIFSALLFWLLLILGRSRQKTKILGFCRWMPFLVLVLPLNYLRSHYPSLGVLSLKLSLGKTGVAFLTLGLLVTSTYIMSRWARAVLAVIETIILGLIPFVAVTFAHAIWFAIDTPRNASAHSRPMQPPARDKRPSSRVLWLLFDEMDQRISFSERPSALALPEIDRLRGEALYAANAYPPAGDTRRSVTALLTGNLVARCDLLEGKKLLITFDGAKQAVDLELQANFFSKAQESGFHSAVVGWYLPYCRLFANSLSSCSWQSIEAPRTGQESALARAMLEQMQGVLPWAPRQEHIDKYLQILEDAKKATVNPQLDVVFVHWPTPHHPPIYDRYKKELGVYPFRRLTDGYLHNLALVDRTLGQIRSAMENAGTWESTTVLLTSDHSWRWARAYDGKADLRVPFLLKLAGQKQPITYEHPFNTVLAHGLLLALLRGELSSPESATRWLDQHRSFGPSPYSRPEM